MLLPTPTKIVGLHAEASSLQPLEHFRGTQEQEPELQVHVNSQARSLPLLGIHTIDPAFDCLQITEGVPSGHITSGSA